MFLIEADYALKYVNSDYTLDVKDVGLTDDDLKDMYQYTKDIATDSKGKLKATTWQATPGLFAYRRSIAKDVLGTDDPDKVQEALSSWDKFNSVAEKALPKVIRCFQVMMIHTEYSLTMYQVLGLILITRLLLMITL